jgi:hypothetical protein
MKSNGRSILIVIIVIAAALAGFALIAARGSLASAQAEVAKAREAEAQAREAKARAQAAARAANLAVARPGRRRPGSSSADAGGAAVSMTCQSPPDGETLRNPASGQPYLSARSSGHSGQHSRLDHDLRTACQQWTEISRDGHRHSMRAKFESLYIVHTAFYAGESGEPAFEVVLNYPGDEKQTDAILCGEDTLDWYVKEGEEKLAPSAKRSALAWTGKGKSGMRDQTVRFCITEIDNKYKDRLVETIDLLSAKNQTAGCILAITVGNKGLLKPEKPADPSPPKDK